MDLRNSNGTELRNFYFYNCIQAFSKIFTRSGKCIMWCLIQVLPNQVSKKSFYTLKIYILTYESPMQNYIKNRVKLLELIHFKG